jgi:5-methyltetrahydropteroyltriglutamate--homocysteine methyltransferase
VSIWIARFYPVVWYAGEMKLLEQDRVLTAIVGSYPTPDYVNPQSGREQLDAFGTAYDKLRQEVGSSAFEELLNRAALESIEDQNQAGIDITTDGEQRRAHYVTNIASSLYGIDGQNRQRMAIREGSVAREVPDVFDRIAYAGPITVDEFRFTQAHAKGIAKIGLPGPATVVDSVVDSYYGDKAELAYDYAAAIHQEVGALVAAGCRVIQLDDPVLLRYPRAAQEWGLDALEQCFKGFEKQAAFIVHICRGYPDKGLELQGVEYKANSNYYQDILGWLADSELDAVSIEGAQNNLDASILSAIGEKTIMLGVLDVGDEAVESVEALVARGTEVLRYVPADQLILAPDCGMVQISRDSALQKLTNLAQAAHLLNDQ